MILVFQASPTWSVHFKWSWFGVGSAADFWPFWHTTAMWIWPWHWWQCWFSGFYGLGHAGTLLYYTLLGWFFGTEYLDVFCVLQVKHSTPSLFLQAELLSSLGCGRFSPTHWESARETNLSASMAVFMDGWRPGPAILGEPSSTKGYWSKTNLSKFQRTHANPLHLQDAMKPFKILQGFLN